MRRGLSVACAVFAVLALVVHASPLPQSTPSGSSSCTTTAQCSVNATSGQCTQGNVSTFYHCPCYPFLCCPLSHPVCAQRQDGCADAGQWVCQDNSSGLSLVGVIVISVLVGLAVIGCGVFFYIRRKRRVVSADTYFHHDDPAALPPPHYDPNVGHHPMSQPAAPNSYDRMDSAVGRQPPPSNQYDAPYVPNNQYGAPQAPPGQWGHVQGGVNQYQPAHYAQHQQQQPPAGQHGYGQYYPMQN